MNTSNAFRPFCHWFLVCLLCLAWGITRAQTIPTVDELLVKPTTEQAVVLSDLYYTKKNYAALLPLAKALSDKGVALGHQYLGYLYWQGHGVTKDIPLGTQLVIKAAAAGVRESEFVAGNNLMNGAGGFPRDPVLGVKFLQASFDFYNDSAYRLAIAYENGEGGLAVDKAKAYSIYKTYKWNANYAKLDDVKKRMEALEPLPTVELMLAKTPEEQSEVLSALLAKGGNWLANYEKLFPLSLALAEKGSPAGQLFLGRDYAYRDSPVKNPVAGFKLMLQAAESGLPLAQAQMGQSLFKDSPGLAADPVLAVKYLQASYKKGTHSDFAYAAFQLATAYEQGLGGLKADIPKALQIYKTYPWGISASVQMDAKERIKALDLNAGAEEVFERVMKAAKGVGVRVDNVRTGDGNYVGEGTIRVNGTTDVSFRAELQSMGTKPPKLFVQFATSDSRLHKPLRERFWSELEAEFGFKLTEAERKGNFLKKVFDSNSTIFNW